MSQKHATRSCPACGGIMRRGVMPETLADKGYSLTHRQPGWHGTACDEGVLEGMDNLVHDAALHEMMAHAHVRR